MGAVMTGDQKDEHVVRSGMTVICTLPHKAVRLSVENGCIIAHLENGETFLVPNEPQYGTLKN